MKFKINVTYKDIEAGDPFSFFNCPIAKAVQRATKTKKFGCSGKLIVSMGSDGYLKEADLPESAIDFVQKFDAIQEVKPFSFEVDINAG